MLPLLRMAAPNLENGALSGRVVLVTGANGGLGRVSALACARAGATVVLSGRKIPALEAVYDEIEALGAPQPAIYPLDLASATAEDFGALADAIERQCGRLDAIIHAAAHFDGLRPIEQAKPLDWTRAQQVNLNAPFLLTQACQPLLRERDDAAVVFVLDDPQRMSGSFWGGYGVSKAGLASLSAILHEETETGPIRVHALLPGPMRTALRRMAYFGEMAAYLVSAAAAQFRGKTFDLRSES
jgi:NAD(P)-dependent dehydrogenase (short-subunit alcohol dehydrogenase family)